MRAVCMSDPDRAPELGDTREVRVAIVGLGQDVEVLLRQAHAPEAIGAAAASDRAHEIRARDAALAFFAVRAREARRRSAAVNALGAVDARRAVVRARDVRA